MGLNVNEMFPSNYLSVGDLKNREYSLVIDRVTPELVGTDNKYVVYFRGADRGLVLNKTNASTIASIYGPEADNWSGQPITLYPAQTEFRGNMVPCIRIKLQPPGNGQRAADAAPPPEPPQQHEAVAEEPIPF